MNATIHRREFLRGLALASAAATVGPLTRAVRAAQAPAGPGRKPNVLLIMTDDQGYGDVACHGNPYIRTPVQDRLSAEGCRFERFFVCPVCSPTRAGLMTGRYNLRTGVHGVTKGQETMRADEITIAQAFKAGGYRTGIFGKWHLGEAWPYAPHARGFDEFVGFRLGHWSEYFDARLERNGKEFQSTGYIADFLTDEAIRFIEANKDRPFFCYLPYNPPHAPWMVPDRYWDMYKDKGLDGEAACAYAMVADIDDNLARLLARLEELKLAEDTIVLFLTDNGLNSDRYNAGMKGRKGSVNEGGVRVPLFIRWPGKIKPGTSVDRIAANVDIFPTLMEMCGLPMPATKPLDGKSLWPLISGKTPAKDWPERMLFFAWVNKGAVRTQQYRLVVGEGGKGKKDKPELYDMNADPGQKNDLADQKPDVTRQLLAAYKDWRQEADAQCGYAPPPIDVGYAEENPAKLAAPRAALHEGLDFKGKSGFANDYIVGWTTTEAWASWEINVAFPGTYEIALKYRCPAADVGAEVEAAVGGQRLTGRITRPMDTPPPPSRDRVPRKIGEVFDLEWALLPLGTIKLDQGRKQLTVKALTKPGKIVMDLEAVMVRKTD